jgi:HK97 family phage major capsid protein
VLDLARVGSTDEGSVEFARQGTYTSVAAETAEASTSSTGTKAEASLPFVKVTEPTQSIAAWAPATRRALSDATEMRALINEQLVWDCRQRLEAQALAGNGTAPNLRGIDGTVGVLTQALGADSVPLALAKAAAQVIAAGWRPNGVVIHPNDWVPAIGTMITSGGSLSETLELPVIVTAAAPEGTAYCGDFRQLAIWIRDVEFFVSIAHADWLVKNIAVALAEVRAAVGVLAPSSLCRVTGV